MELGEKIRRLRLMHDLTQEELAQRCDLSKGFISQLERDLTSPSIATLIDILECLGQSLKSFFSGDAEEEKIVFGEDDIYDTKDTEKGTRIAWLIPNAQKNEMEPILIELRPGSSSTLDNPHEGEEFGYVLSGGVVVELGGKAHRAKKGESFYFRPSSPHRLRNPGKQTAKILWISTPPSF